VETLDFLGKSIHLNGYDPNFVNLPVVDANGAGPVMRFTTHEDPNCRVTGFSLRGGWDDLAGGILCVNSAPTFDRCLIAGNRVSGPLGAAVHATDSFPSFENCTIAENVGGAGIRLIRSQVIIANTIVWNNGPTDLHVTDGQPPKVSYSLLESFWPGPGNLSADPLFARPGLWLNAEDPNLQQQPTHPEALWLPGDYHPRSTTGRWHPQIQTWLVDTQHSPAIDAGDPNSDLALEPPPHADRINIGVYGGTQQASKSE
ncbi:MAG: hypothetical protein IIA65_01300, partial [Planctomycetes bacterium]|nr:hypothetical protein [Planctomycetota bacterium]